MSSNKKTGLLSQVLRIESSRDIGFFIGRMRQWQRINPRKCRKDFIEWRLSRTDGNLSLGEVYTLSVVCWDPKNMPRSEEEILARL